MELTRRLLSLSVPHPFVATVPGATAVRLAVEKELRVRGWAAALSPADADMLVLCGTGGPDFEEAAARVWAQLPAPRTRAAITDSSMVAVALDRARAELNDPTALSPSARGTDDDGHQGHNMTGKDMNGHQGHDMGHDHNHSSMDMDGGNQGHDMEDMDMELPGGLEMAGRAPDRDGLKLDQLQLVLGPILPFWPAGLVLRLLLQGDVAQSAEVSVLDAGAGTSFWFEALATAAGLDNDGSSGGRGAAARIRAAAAADSLQRFLGVAGWDSASRTGRRLRDELLDPAFEGPLHPRFARWLRRVRGSRVLRWSTNGLGPVGAAAPVCLQGDVTARWLRWTDDIAAVVDSTIIDTVALPERDSGTPAAPNRAAAARAALSVLPSLLAGRELAAVRLIVASLDPDIEALHAHEEAPHHHG